MALDCPTLAPIATGNAVLDLAWSPREELLVYGLLTGELVLTAPSSNEKARCRPCKRSVRAVGWSQKDGESVVVAGTKDGSVGLYRTDGLKEVWRTGERHGHRAAVNCLAAATLDGQGRFATGDEDGTVKLWDARQAEASASYSHHSDLVTELVHLGEKHQIISVSADGTLAVMDTRKIKKEKEEEEEALFHSHEQGDELLSAVVLPASPGRREGERKLVVGTAGGPLLFYDLAWGVQSRQSFGLEDFTSKLPGHPTSVDSLAVLMPPAAFPDESAVLITASSDGFIRALQPPRFLGLIGDHGDELPVEKVKVDRTGQWVASSSHDEMIRFWYVGDTFEPDEPDEAANEVSGDDVGAGDGDGDDDGDDPRNLGRMSEATRFESAQNPTLDEMTIDHAPSRSPSPPTRRPRKTKKQKKINAAPEPFHDL